MTMPEKFKMHMQDVGLIPVPQHVPDVDFAFKVKGDSMEPLLMDGDIVFFKAQPVFNGEIAAVLVDGKACVKKCFVYPGRIVLESLNPKYEPMCFIGDDTSRLFLLGKAIQTSRDTPDGGI